MRNIIQINTPDNVAVALSEIAAGETTCGLTQEIVTRETIPQAHKVALCQIRAGEPVIKYGNPIGFAKTDIAVGEHVHVHNLRTGLGTLLEYDYEPISAHVPPLPADTFQGFLRKDGSVGIRNDIWILPTVGCVNGIAQQLANLAGAYVSGTVGKIIDKSEITNISVKFKHFIVAEYRIKNIRRVLKTPCDIYILRFQIFINFVKPDFLSLCIFR